MKTRGTHKRKSKPDRNLIKHLKPAQFKSNYFIPVIQAETQALLGYYHIPMVKKCKFKEAK